MPKITKKKRLSKKKIKKKKQVSPYFSHLEDLRFKILSVLIFFFIAFGFSFYYIDEIMKFLSAPLSGLGVKLNYFKPHEKFLAYLKVSFFSGLIATIPFALVRAAEFIFPALKKKERGFFIGAFIVLPFLFAAGSFFAYKIILPLAFDFFVKFAGTTSVNEVWGIDAYFSFILTIIFVSGVVFLFPPAFLILIKAGVISARQLAGARLYLVLGILIVAALFTPPDVITQVLLAVPLYILFEITIFIGKIMDKKSD